MPTPHPPKCCFCSSNEDFCTRSIVDEGRHGAFFKGKCRFIARKTYSVPGPTCTTLTPSTVFDLSNINLQDQFRLDCRHIWRFHLKKQKKIPQEYYPTFVDLEFEEDKRERLAATPSTLLVPKTLARASPPRPPPSIGCQCQCQISDGSVGWKPVHWDHLRLLVLNVR